MNAELLCPADQLKTFTHTAAADYSAGDMQLINGLLSIAYADIANGDEGEMVYSAALVEAPKAAVQIDAPEVAYWDDTAKNITNISTGNTKCGLFTESFASSDENCVFELQNVI